MLFFLILFASPYVVDLYHNFKRNNLKGISVQEHQNLYEIEYNDYKYHISKDFKTLEGLFFKGEKKRQYPLDDDLTLKILKKHLKNKQSE